MQTNQPTTTTSLPTPNFENIKRDDNIISTLAGILFLHISYCFYTLTREQRYLNFSMLFYALIIFPLDNTVLWLAVSY